MKKSTLSKLISPILIPVYALFLLLLSMLSLWDPKWGKSFLTATIYAGMIADYLEDFSFGGFLPSHKDL